MLASNIPTEAPGERTVIAVRPFAADITLVLARGERDYVTWHLRDGEFSHGVYRAARDHEGSWDTALNAALSDFNTRGPAYTPLTILSPATRHERDALRSW